MTKSILNKDPKLSKTKKEEGKVPLLGISAQQAQKLHRVNHSSVCYQNKQLLDEVFVISRIIKFEVGVVS